MVHLMILDLYLGKIEMIKNKKSYTYTPDFIFIAPDNKTVIIMEIKGFQNDTYPLKEKMFRGYLEDLLHKSNQPTMFFQIKNKTQLLEAINIINTKFGKNE